MRQVREAGGRSDLVIEAGHELVVVEQMGASCWDRLVSLVVHHDPDRDLEVYHEMVDAVELGLAIRCSSDLELM